MAAKGSEMALALVVVLLMWHEAWAQAGCSNTLMSLAPCLNFVNGNLTKPSSACCSSLTGLIQTQPQCLCTMTNGSGPMAGLVLALPAACNVQIPPVSQCNTASGPATSIASPASAPVGSTPSDTSSSHTPVTTKTPSTSSQTNTPSSTGTGSKSTPSTTGASSGASTTTSPIPLVFISFAVPFALRAIKF